MATKDATKTTTKRGEAASWTDEEVAAMQEHARDLKRKKTGKVDGTQDILDKIAAMPESDRVMAERIHAIIGEVAPHLTHRTWYGMPAYAKDGKLICFFQAADKFKARYATFGVEENARLDDGNMWPTSWALTKITPEVEKQIAAIVRQAAG